MHCTLDHPTHASIAGPEAVEGVDFFRNWPVALSSLLLGSSQFFLEGTIAVWVPLALMESKRMRGITSLWLGDTSSR